MSLFRNFGLLGGLLGGAGRSGNTLPPGGAERPQPPRGLYDPREVEINLREAIALAAVIANDSEAIMSETRDLGYNHLHSVEVAAGEISHGFQSRLEDHRLIINQCNYPDAVRHMVHVHIPGSMAPETMAQVRKDQAFIGSEGVYEGTFYAHWKKRGRGQPQFVDIWVDFFEGGGQPLTRMMMEVVQERTEKI